MLRVPALFALVVCIVSSANGHDIITTNLTYSRDVAPIFAARCVSCHSSGASIPLTEYGQVRPWAVDIKEQVLSRQMPPWGAAKGFGDLKADGALSMEELQIIAAWVVGGAPEGEKRSGSTSSVTETPCRAGTTGGAEMVVEGATTLRSAMRVVGIWPLPDRTIASDRIVAVLPDGETVPMVWLFGYDPRWKQSYSFRTPIVLPAGTRIEAETPLRFAVAY